MNQLQIVGVGLAGRLSLIPEAAIAIDRADILIGSNRFLKVLQEKYLFNQVLTLYSRKLKRTLIK